MADPKTHLPMDRRLLGRSGFVRAEERDQYIANLPDVGEKGEFVDVPGQAAASDDSAAAAAPDAAPEASPLGGFEGNSSEASPSDDAGPDGSSPEGSGFGSIG